ncbi:MAG: glycosyltransferase family 2 protein, partial [Candidatus Omnitrophica bacterium]|nr:glycosyltransferase family 2 protein [Candidatus Omnitrophota bacterium]
MRNSDYKVGIIVVNYNGFEYSSDCIDSLLKSDYKLFEIIFVDNGSKDGSAEMIRNRFKDTINCVFLSENKGVTGGNNAGIDFAVKRGCDYALFLNNDTVVEHDFLTKMMLTSRECGQALVAPKIVCDFDRRRIDHWVGKDYDWWRSRPQGHKVYPFDNEEFSFRADIKVASTCCLLVPISVINRIGMMDENYFMYLDDADFTIRASRAGYRIIYEPEAMIYHKCNKTTGGKQPSYFEYYLLTRNVFYFYRKLCKNNSAKAYFFSRIIIF